MCPRFRSILENCLSCWEEMCILWCLVDICRCLLRPFDVWCRLILMFLFIFCPDGLSLGESGLLKPHTISGLMITSLFNSRGVLYEIGCPRVWCIYVEDSNCDVLLVDCSLCYNQVSFFVLSVWLALVWSLLSGIRIAMSACLVPLVGYFFPSCHSKVVLS